ncbi:tetratricopeptide repeat protein [Jejudonia soesokkakensis]|uniref:Tetratricopeptide repeat protein n=1 Tax=Jejudonia soesokkakensis TaxID=1323432 RepID=A0ABW2MWN9_9FLAO
MEKLLKYCLNCMLLMLLFSCSNSKDTYSHLSQAERQKLSIEVFNDGSHLPQGSVKSMTRIEKAIAIDPTHCDAVRELSVAYLKRGMPDKWKPQMDKAVACNPELWVGYRGYNYLWFYRDYKKAIADFDATDSLTPDFTEAPQGHSVNFWRGIAYLGLNNYEKSLSYFDKHIDKETKESGEDWVEQEAFLYKAIAHYENNQPEQALESLDKVLHYSKNLTADGKYYKGLILFEKGRCEEAMQFVDNAILDFNNGYFNSRPYVETLRQIYVEDLTQLKTKLGKCLNAPI